MRHKIPAAILAFAIAGSALAAVVHTTAGPFGGFFGLWGPDVSSQQSVGARFIPSGDFTLTSIKMWFMNNSSTTHPTVKITLRTDQTAGTVSTPSSTVIEQWTINIQALGWNPIQEVLLSTGGVALQSGVKYWVVAESTASSGSSSVWNYASVGNTFSATTLSSGAWQPGGSGAALTLTVEGTVGLPNPADINGDGVVNGIDLSFVLSAWGACASCQADINRDGTVDGFDLAVLLTAWSA